jgi:hypothetical protein
MALKLLGASSPAGRKGQSEIMEYMLMVVFIVASVIGIILFLTWWNVTQLDMKKTDNLDDKAEGLTQQLKADFMLTNTDSVFDDAKLTSLIPAGVKCADLEKEFGSNWYAKIIALDMDKETPCTWDNYPDCNTWSLCIKKARGDVSTVWAKQPFPVNVYRRASDRIAMGVLYVEVYS